MNSLQDMKPTVNGLELMKYTCQDWRKELCSRERKKLKTKTRYCSYQFYFIQLYFYKMIMYIYVYSFVIFVV